MEIRSKFISILLTFSYVDYSSPTILIGITGNVDDKNNLTLARNYVGVEEKPALVTADNLILMKADSKYDEDERLQLLSHHEKNSGLERRARVGISTRKDRFYYCGPRNKRNYCRSLCYAMGYPTYICGNVSCYCTF